MNQTIGEEVHRQNLIYDKVSEESLVLEKPHKRVVQLINPKSAGVDVIHISDRERERIRAQGMFTPIPIVKQRHDAIGYSNRPIPCRSSLTAPNHYSTPTSLSLNVYDRMYNPSCLDGELRSKRRHPETVIPTSSIATLMPAFGPKFKERLFPLSNENEIYEKKALLEKEHKPLRFKDVIAQDHWSTNNNNFPTRITKKVDINGERLISHDKYGHTFDIFKPDPLSSHIQKQTESFKTINRGNAHDEIQERQRKYQEARIADKSRRINQR